MNQPHPPLPDYRPERTPEDLAAPRTQSILMPPTGAEDQAAEDRAAPAQEPVEQEPGEQVPADAPAAPGSATGS